jgi:hypothetical protein
LNLFGKILSFDVSHKIKLTVCGLMIFVCVFLIFPIGYTCLLNFRKKLSKKKQKRKNSELLIEEENYLISTYDTGFVDVYSNVSRTSVPLSDDEKK